MASRPRPPSAPGPGRGRSGRRPARTTPTTRRTTRSTSGSGVAAEPSASARAKLTGRAAILFLVLAVLAVSYASSMRAWLEQRSEINTLTAQIAEREAAVAGLEQAKRRWRDDEFIESQAKLRFAWVMPGETGYRVIGDDGKVLTDARGQLPDPPTNAATDDPEWWDSAWGSVVEAGRDPAAEAAAEPRTRTRIDPIGRPKDDKPGTR